MSSSALGALLGATAGAGMWLVAVRVRAVRRAGFDLRVLRPLSDLPQLRPLTPAEGTPTAAASTWRLIVSPWLEGAARRLERLLGGTASVRRRIERAGLEMTVHEFRLQQVTWGLVAFGVGSVLALLAAVRAPDRFVPLAVLAVLAGVLGVLLRENRLTAQVRAHEVQVMAELPAVAELLALSVAAGEGPVAAVERVVARSNGAFSRDLARVLADVNIGTSVTAAFDALAARTGLPVVARFASGIAVAVDRGTPLADVLHAQAGDVREAQRRTLIESGARREVLMMVPVVFLVLPTTVMFAFWPGLVGLRMVTP